LIYNNRTWTDEVNSTTLVYNITCVDDNGDSTYSIDKYINLIIDIVNPNITINNPPVDGSGVYLNASNVTINFTLTDDNLYAFNLTCYNKSTGLLHYSEQVLDLNDTIYNYSKSLSFRDIGVEECNLTAADGHTDEEFKAAYYTEPNKIVISPDRIDTNIEIIYDDRNSINLDKFEMDEEYDRLSPIFNFNVDSKDVPVLCEKGQILNCQNPDTNYEDVYWTVKYEGTAYYREPTSGIKGHIIILPENGDITKGIWYDAVDNFNGSNIDIEIDNVNREVRYHERIKYGDFYKSKEIQMVTRSLGGLNSESVLWNFTILESKAIDFYAHNIYDNADILEFNLTVNNGSIYNYSTANGSISIVIGNESNTIFVFSDDYYNNHTLISVDLNTSESYNYSFWQTELTITTVNLQDGSIVADVNMSTLNDTIYYSNSSNPSIFYLNISDYVLSVTGPIINGSSDYYTGITALGTYSYQFNVSSNFSVNIFDELTTDYFNMSSPDSITQYVYCSSGTTYSYDIVSNSSSFIPPCQFDKIKYSVQYPSERYYRTLLPRAFNISTGNVSVWLVNLDTTQVIFNTFEIYTLIYEYENLRLYFKKNIGADEYVITSDYINVENKVGTYLMLGEEYTVEIVADNYDSRNLGFYTADVEGEKIIRLFEIDFNPNPTDIYYNSTWWLETDNTTSPDRAKVTYYSENVDEVTLTVYNNSISGAQLYTTTLYTDTGIFYYAPSATYENYTFLMNLNITTDDNGTSVVFNKVWRSRSDIPLQIVLLGYISQNWLQIFLSILLGVIALLFTVRTADIGGVVFIGIASMFIYFGWWYISAVSFGLAAVSSVINFLKKRDMEH